MKEKSKSCPLALTMATALLETGPGNGSSPESTATDNNPPKNKNKKNAKSFFIVSQ